MSPHSRAQEPLRHAQHLALFHYATRRRRPWWPRVALVAVALALLGVGLAVVPEPPSAVVLRSARN